MASSQKIIQFSTAPIKKKLNTVSVVCFKICLSDILECSALDKIDISIVDLREAESFLYGPKSG